MRTLTRTLRIPVKPDDETAKILVKTMKVYSKAAQMAFNYDLSNNTSSRVKIHHGIYKDFRKLSSLNSQLVINGKNKGVDVLKSLKMKIKNSSKKKNKKNVKIPQVKFNSILPMRYEYRCSTINLEQQNVSLATISNRVNLFFEISKYYQKFIKWKFKSFELVYIHRRFFIYFVVENPISQELLNSPHSRVFVGIDPVWTQDIPHNIALHLISSLEQIEMGRIFNARNVIFL